MSIFPIRLTNLQVKRLKWAQQVGWSACHKLLYRLATTGGNWSA
jgi:hypothetical protein